MKTLKVADVLKSEQYHQEIAVNGWGKAFRSNRFLALNDGSTINNLQCVIDFENLPEDILKEINIGAAVRIKGILEESEGAGQRVEIQVKDIKIEGVANPEDVKLTILSPKRHSLEKLREQAHLRVRTNTGAAVMRLRSKLSFAVHKYFQDNGFYYVNTPIITGSDAEGAGEMFKVTAMDLKNPAKNEDGSINYKEDFFGKETNLTVSG